MTHDFPGTRTPRRAFLSDMSKLASAGLVCGWAPLYRIPAHAQSAGAAPPNFPSAILLYKQAFQNWSGEIRSR